MDARTLRVSARRALVTGASGFIGPHLISRLQAGGYAITALRHSAAVQRTPTDGSVEVCEADIADPAAVWRALERARPEVVFHLAGLIKAFDQATFDRVNVQGAVVLAEACAGMESPPVLVLVSSLAAAGPARDGRPVEEGDPARPVSMYGRSKLGGEQAALPWAGRIPLTIVRPPMVIGPGDLATLPMFRSVARFGLHLQAGRAAPRFSVVHVTDLAAGIVAAGEHGVRVAANDAGLVLTETGFERGCYFMADEARPTFGEIGQAIARAVGRDRARVVRLPAMFAWGLAAGSEAVARVRGRAHVFGFDKIREATAGSWICSPARAAAEVGFTPGATLEERFTQTAAWYRERGWL